MSMHACTTSASLRISSWSAAAGSAGRTASREDWAASVRCRQAVRPRHRHQQPGPVVRGGGRKPPEQPEQAHHPAVLDQGHGVPLHEIGGLPDVAADQRVRHGLGHQALLGEPRRGPGVQVGDAVRMVAIQATSEVVGEQMVVAEPFAFAVERTKEQVPTLEFLEHRLSVTAGGEDAGELAAETITDRGREQELEEIGRERIQHVLRQVLAHRVMTPGEAADQRGRVGAVPQGQRRQLQCRDPPVGTGGELRDGVAVEAQTIELDEELPGLVEVEAQRVGVDLHHVPPHAQPAQRQLRPATAGQHDRQVGRREVHQVHQRPPRRSFVDEVPVVEREHDPALVVAHDLQERRQGVALHVLGVLLDQGSKIVDRLVGRGEGPTHGLEQVREEPVRIDVVAVQTQPGHQCPGVLQDRQPLHRQRRLPVAGRCMDHREPARFGTAQTLEDPPPLDDVVHVRRRPESR